MKMSIIDFKMKHFATFYFDFENLKYTMKLYENDNYIKCSVKSRCWWFTKKVGKWRKESNVKLSNQQIFDNICKGFKIIPENIREKTP